MIVLDGKPKATNQLLGSHFFTKHKNAQVWKNLIKCVIGKNLPQEPLTKAKLTFIRYSNRTLDFDGCVASMKPLSDGLVESKVIKNDTYTITGDWVVSQKFLKRTEGSMIYILVESLSNASN